MIGSLLIANRGEIAVRIIRTARRLGVRTVAVYSDIDAHSPHVDLADTAWRIGPAPARESYLDGARIIEAAKATGAEAIHPGYGFLSENAAFAKAVIDAGLIWVGPPPAAIAAMGPKDAAKDLMAKAGVAVTPGYLGDDQSEARLKAEADRIGYPILIKAVAGGGGKGMRRVDQPGDFAAALASCRREAANSFGDDRVLLETYVTRPRHIEVQVFADSHGNFVHLHERDCSLQRRHQKVIEEAPAPGMDAETRAAVCGAAVRAAQAVGYRGAGTVEFIADASEGLRADRIWFMEMNTRLQVEHPVTEMITGQDLVEWQLRVASGEPLPLRQDQIPLQGWAMEARLYAEDPAAGFLPSVGALDHFHLPQESVRVDTGARQGGEVSAFYDPMIAKLIAHGPDREAAARLLSKACAETEVWPVKTNAGFLARALVHPRFLLGDVDTGFINRESDALIPPAEPPADAYAAAAALLRPAPQESDKDPWTRLEGFRANTAPHIGLGVQFGDERRWVDLAQGAAGSVRAARIGETAVVFSGGEAYGFTQAQAQALDADGPASDGALRPPIPGIVAAVHVAVGDRVAKGQAVVIVEAMKTEHTLGAPFDGVIEEVLVKAGDQVAEGAVLVRLVKED